MIWSIWTRVLVSSMAITSKFGTTLRPTEVLISAGEGGLSGAPLGDRSNDVIGFIHGAANGALPIIGVGGVFTAADAWDKICSGASLIQLYTAFIYEGPGVARRINEGLGKILKREGFRSLDEAVGCRVVKP